MSCRLSVVVVAYDMARELPRTVRSLLPPFQRDIATDDYEIIVVDNGSAVPVTLSDFVPLPLPVSVRVHRVDPAPPSPARAANEGVALATGDLVGLVVDGARLASPRLLAHALLAQRTVERGVISSPTYHIGPVRHMDAAAAGYDQRVEDDLLDATGWEADGEQLFAISTLAGSSSRGWFGPMGESSALFMPRVLWDELGGLDEHFVLPGGGLVNHDLYRRACALDDIELVVLLGDGTFHQFHGGAATARRYTWDEMHAEYESLRGMRYRAPENAPLYLGRVPASALGHIERSAQLAVERNARLGKRSRTL